MFFGSQAAGWGSVCRRDEKRSMRTGRGQDSCSQDPSGCILRWSPTESWVMIRKHDTCFIQRLHQRPFTDTKWLNFGFQMISTSLSMCVIASHFNGGIWKSIIVPCVGFTRFITRSWPMRPWWHGFNLSCAGKRSDVRAVIRTGFFRSWKCGDFLWFCVNRQVT